MKVVWSLFDGSGIMGLPWAEAGYQVYCFNADDADHGPYDKFHARNIHENIKYVNAWIDINFMNAAIAGVYGKPNIIFAFPPCTDMSVSGSRAFESKRKKDPMFQEKAVFTALIASKIADHFNVPYVVENPVSVLSSFWRKPDHIFNPWEYGGYLPENDVHPFFPEYINPRDSYPKKTCFWTGNGFKMPEKKIVPVKEGYSNQYHKLGGKSAKTKVIRSLTPRGIAIAVFRANHHDPS